MSNHDNDTVSMVTTDRWACVGKESWSREGLDGLLKAPDVAVGLHSNVVS